MEQVEQQSQMFNKEQAANFLGKSAKAVQRYTASGQLPVVYVKEKGSQRAYYKLEDLQHFKEHGYTAKPVLDTIDKVDSKSLVQGQHSPEKIIAELVGRVLNEAQKRGLLNLSAPGATSPDRSIKERLTVPIADKMILTISEASVLSGRPQAELRKAFLSGKLHGVKLGRGIKVRNKDLELYIDGLFEKS